MIYIVCITNELWRSEKRYVSKPSYNPTFISTSISMARAVQYATFEEANEVVAQIHAIDQMYRAFVMIAIYDYQHMTIRARRVYTANGDPFTHDARIHHLIPWIIGANLIVAIAVAIWVIYATIR